MSGDREKRGLWGLFRTLSSARISSGKVMKDGNNGGVGGRPSEAARSDLLLLDQDRRRRPRRTGPRAAKGKDLHVMSGGRGPCGPRPLTEWPPSGMSSGEELSLGHAIELVSRGVPAFKGHKRPIAHASNHYYALFSTTAGNLGDETDRADAHNSMTQLMTLSLTAPEGGAKRPWETLEQPSYLSYFGKVPGTITLNYWANMASVLPPPIALRDPGVEPRAVELDRILDRLQDLEGGLEEAEEDLMYRNLYRKFLRDPDKDRSPHKTLDKQITDLIMVLSRPSWWDLSNPRNQVVTRYMFDTSSGQHSTYHKIFHQLLFAVELDARINSKHHLAEAKEKLTAQLPPKIQWDLGLARRWRKNVRIETVSKKADRVQFRFKLQRRQVRMLKRFAQMMKWPNLEKTVAALHRRQDEGTLHLLSSHAMAFFSGLVLPGPTFPFLIMNALIDIDPNEATDELALLTHLHPHCGFQYRNSYTYWTAQSIVGKVLAPSCHSLAGWIGPARPTSDLASSEMAKIRARRPLRQQPTAEDVRSMQERSDPLGPPTQVFPVKEYALVSPEHDSDTKTIDVERLILTPCADRVHEGGPTWFDASLQFSINNISWPLRLAFNVSFISAWPCTEAPHPLFFDYVYERVSAAHLVKVRDWNGVYGGRSVQSLNTAEDGDTVLVVEALGLVDGEVLARAWCAHWGLSAVVAEVGTTCMACAIREAYAATLTVVILVDYRERENFR